MEVPSTPVSAINLAEYLAPQNPLQPTEGLTEPSEDNGEGTDKGNGNNLAPVQTQR